MAKDNSLDKLLERKAKLDARIQAIRSRESQQARKDDARRKVLVGALVLKAVESNQNQKLWLDGLLDNGLKRDDDRKLFNMPPLAAPAAAPENAKAAPAAAAPAAPEKAPDKPAPAGPVRYPVFTFAAEGTCGAWMPDFQTLATKGKTPAEALERATANIRNAVKDGPRTASDERAAKEAFAIYAGPRFGSNPPQDVKLAWVEAE